MIYALISDVHGNLEALTAVLKDINDNSAAEKIAFLGDAVGYGANPNEVLAIINSECEVKLMGNHDYTAIGLLDASDFNPYARQAIEFTTAVLSSDAISILASLKLTCEAGEMQLVHATPDAPSAWNYCLSIHEAERQFGHFQKRICCLGHSHKPIVYGHTYAGETHAISPDEVRLEKESRYIVNIGSVGQPRDGDPRACYALFDSEEDTLSYRRVAYDVATAQAKMAAVNLPDFLIERLSSGK
ncbi:MAG: metallophosphoesterase family protein [Candidatus Zixiibacteriota bacterium]